MITDALILCRFRLKNFRKHVMTALKQQIEKIILVDDDEDDREFFADAFDTLNIRERLVMFESGQAFLDYIEKLDCSIPTFLFLDLNMPILSGMDVLKLLRQKLKLDNIIITIYSTSSSLTDIENAYINGANSYLKKPSNFQGLNEMILKALDTASINGKKQLSKKNFLLDQD